MNRNCAVARELWEWAKHERMINRNYGKSIVITNVASRVLWRWMHYNKQ